MGNVARSHESIARLENEDLVSDDDLQFSGENIVRLILTHMRMSGHAYPRRETHLQEAVCSSGICARPQIQEYARVRARESSKVSREPNRYAYSNRC